jgi:hypothetical protein
MGPSKIIDPYEVKEEYNYYKNYYPTKYQFKYFKFYDKDKK